MHVIMLKMYGLKLQQHQVKVDKLQMIIQLQV
jgi:hypothetical protein